MTSRNECEDKTEKEIFIPDLEAESKLLQAEVNEAEYLLQSLKDVRIELDANIAEADNSGAWRTRSRLQSEAIDLDTQILEADIRLLEARIAVKEAEIERIEVERIAYNTQHRDSLSEINTVGSSVAQLVNQSAANRIFLIRQQINQMEHTIDDHRKSLKYRGRTAKR